MHTFLSFVTAIKNAKTQQLNAKAKAPKEAMKTPCSDGEEGTKKAVKVTLKKKLSEDVKQAKTAIAHALQTKKATKSILVKRKKDGSIVRIPKDKFDPSLHIRTQE